MANGRLYIVCKCGEKLFFGKFWGGYFEHHLGFDDTGTQADKWIYSHLSGCHNVPCVFGDWQQYFTIEGE